MSWGISESGRIEPPISISKLTPSLYLGWCGPWGTTYPTNLRLYFQEITEEQWVQVAKTMQRRPPMPYYALNAMTEPDVRAVYRYIRSLGPAGKPAPKYLPADSVPPQPYVQFPEKME
jgi:hypothetical protein